MSEEEIQRLRKAVDRLMDAQQEALETSDRVLGYGDEILDDAELTEAPAPLEDSALLRAALEDVRAVLEGASEDVRGILENDA